MNPAEFKKVIAETKENLRGKTLTIHFQNGSRKEKLKFNTLKGFGKAILELESKGAGFGFMKVQNKLVSKPMIKASEYLKRLERGVWDEFIFLATTVK